MNRRLLHRFHWVNKIMRICRGEEESLATTLGNQPIAPRIELFIGQILCCSYI
jgi:hypothetical protein